MVFVLPTTLRKEAKTLIDRLFVNKTTSNADEVRDWYRKCGKLQIPFVQILTRRNLACIEWDLFVYEFDEITRLKTHQEAVEEQLYYLYLAHKPMKPSRHGHFFCGGMENIAPETAPLLAGCVFGLLYQTLIDVPGFIKKDKERQAEKNRESFEELAAIHKSRGITSPYNPFSWPSSNEY